MTGAMHIFRPSVPEGYEWAVPTDSGDLEVIRALGERPPGGPWTPIPMALLKVDEHGQSQKRSDLPWLGGHVLVLRDEAIEAVGEILRPHGELLPLVCDEARLALFSAPVVQGVLDEARSDMVRFGSGRIMALRTPAFRRSALGGRGAFRLAEMPRGDLYLTGHVVEAIRSTGMTAGTHFTLAYGEGSES